MTSCFLDPGCDICVPNSQPPACFQAAWSISKLVDQRWGRQSGKYNLTQTLSKNMWSMSSNLTSTLSLGSGTCFSYIQTCMLVWVWVACPYLGRIPLESAFSPEDKHSSFKWWKQAKWHVAVSRNALVTSSCVPLENTSNLSTLLP